MSEDPNPFRRDTADADAAPAPDRDVAQAELSGLRRRLEEQDRSACEERERHARILEEVQHRARNTLALVRSVFGRTIETGESVEEIERHFYGRLDVLARYHLPGSLHPDDSMDLERVIRDEFQDFRFGDMPGITIRGPNATLRLDQAQAFALMIHELVTNALKYGALAVDQAKLRVTWTLADDHLDLTWRESGVPIVSAAPLRRGFGREFIEDAIPYQTGAVTEFELRPGGVACRVRLPVGVAPRARRGVRRR